MTMRLLERVYIMMILLRGDIILSLLAKIRKRQLEQQQQTKFTLQSPPPPHFFSAQNICLKFFRLEFKSGCRKY